MSDVKLERNARIYWRPKAGGDWQFGVVNDLPADGLVRIGRYAGSAVHRIVSIDEIETREATT